MQLRKPKSKLSVLDAVDNLAQMAELDVSSRMEMPLSEGQVSSWHDPESREYNQQRVKETFAILLMYVKDICSRDKKFIQEDRAQKGMQAIMLLAQEAAKKIDGHSQIFAGEKLKSVAELREYKELQHYYLTQVVQRFQPLKDVETKWQKAWGSGETRDWKEAALKDLEAVRRDREYELFLIRKEDGRPYFNRSLLYHMQLVGQFDALMADSTMEDPFSRIQVAADREAYASAKEILKAAQPYADDFFKDGLKYKHIGYVADIGMAMMALMMTANSRNLMPNAIKKYSLLYFADFQFYLRRALGSPEYRKFLSNPSSSSERFIHIVVNLSHVLCSAFFMKIGSRKEAVDLIHALIETGSKGSLTQSETASPTALWNNLKDKDAAIRYLFSRYPNGPLLKTVEIFNKDQELRGFDPIRQQQNLGQMYTFSNKEMHVSCLRLPCPTLQRKIDKALIVEEFDGFLRSLAAQNSHTCHLLINLQDRTNRQEHTRSATIEKASKKMGSYGLMTVTLPKDTDFYLQTGSFIEWDDAKEFTKQLKEQVAGGEQCGYYFPSEIDQEKLVKFVDQAISVVHSVFFGNKKRLVHKNRLDFIEIFYLLLTLKLIEELKPDTLSFSCKDAIDTGAVASAEVFAFLRMMNDSSHFTKVEENFLLWMLYFPALTARQRAVDGSRFSRMVSSLALIAAELEAHHCETMEACSKLYKLPFFKGLKVQESVL